MAFNDDDVVSNEENSGFVHTDSSFFRKSDVDVYWDLIFKQLRHCCAEGSEEMTVGGIVTRYINGQVIDINLPNQREKYDNSVFQLGILVGKFLNSKDNGGFKDKLEELNDGHNKERGKIILLSNDPGIMELKKVILKTNNEGKRNSATKMYNDMLKTNKKQLEELKTEHSKQLMALYVEIMNKERFGKRKEMEYEITQIEPKVK